MPIVKLTLNYQLSFIKLKIFNEKLHKISFRSRVFLHWHFSRCWLTERVDKCLTLGPKTLMCHTMLHTDTQRTLAGIANIWWSSSSSTSSSSSSSFSSWKGRGWLVTEGAMKGNLDSNWIYQAAAEWKFWLAKFIRALPNKILVAAKFIRQLKNGNLAAAQFISRLPMEIWHWLN